MARPKSLITGKDMKITWSANWDDNLGGVTGLTATRTCCSKSIADKVKLEFEQTFMFYLPRICEHCLNPSCAASCPSGAIYKRAEDGIVLVDQDRCRGWRMCVTGCPYKKIYFNHRTGKAEKCTFCFPRIEVGIPTVCSETCVGRLRYIGLMLYDADRSWRPPRPPDDDDLYEAQRAVFLDPHDPQVIARGRAGRHPARLDRGGAALARLRADQHATRWRCRCIRSTAPCRWSGTSRRCRRSSTSCATPATTPRTRGNLFAAIDALRIPIEYLAELFTAGDPAPVDARPAHASPRCARTCATSTSAASRTSRSPPPSA